MGSLNGVLGGFGGGVPAYLRQFEGLSASEIGRSVNKTKAISQGIDLVTFDSLDGWLISSGDETKITVDTSKNPFSTGGAFRYVETENGGSLGLTKTTDINLTTHDVFNIFIKTADNTRTGNIELFFYSDINLTANYYNVSLKPKMNTYGENYWNNISFTKDDFIANGTIEWTDLIKKIKIVFYGASGQLYDISIAGLKAGLKPRKAITFSFDDANETDYTEAYRILKKYGFSGTSYIISEDIGQVYPSRTCLTLSQMQEMYDNGWTFGNHGKDYLNFVTESTVTEAEISIKTCRDWLYNNGFTNALEHLAYPHGEYNEEVKAVMSKYGIKYGRTVNQFIQNAPIEDFQEIKCFALRPELQDNIDMLNNLMNNYYGCINLYGHELLDNQDVKLTASEFEVFVKYIYDNYREYVTTIPEWCKDYEAGTII